MRSLRETGPLLALCRPTEALLGIDACLRAMSYSGALL